MTTSKTSTWRIPLLLVVLSAVPIVAGIVRVAGLDAPAQITDENARFVGSPLPVVLHVVGVTLYALLGAFQFSAGIRRRWPRWHRWSGRVAAPAGLVSALTGLWMAAAYDIPARLQGPVLLWVRLAVGTAIVIFIVQGIAAILRRDVPRHEAMMIRAYALSQGAGTQVVVFLPLVPIFGEIHFLARDLLMTFTWSLNLAIAEWIIRRRAKPRSVTVPATASVQPG
jgi:hypothetical protein